NVAAFAAVAPAVGVYYALPHAWLKVAWGVGVGAFAYVALRQVQDALLSRQRRTVERAVRWAEGDERALPGADDLARVRGRARGGRAGRPVADRLDRAARPPHAARHGLSDRARAVPAGGRSRRAARRAAPGRADSQRDALLVPHAVPGQP